MQTTRWTPLRTSVGKPIPILAETVTVRGTFADRLIVRNYTSFSNIELPSDLLPEQLSLSTSDTNYQRDDGVATYPGPPDLPFLINNQVPPIPFLTLFGFGDVVEEDISRDLWFELCIDVAESVRLFSESSKDGQGLPTVGGVCYGGYPFMPYYVTDEGENSANFGLPRELRIGWRPDSGDGFLDDHSSYSMQTPAGHSGVHLAGMGPVKTEKITVRFSDLPRRLLRIPRGDAPVEQWYCVIPFLYLYEHSEQTRYRPKVPAGLLAANHIPPQHARTYTSVVDPDKPDPARESVEAVAADFIYTTGVPLQYFPLSAASLFGQSRHYGMDLNGGQELFWSQSMTAKDQLRLTIQQTEEHRRCLAGLRLKYPKSAQSEASDEFEVSIFEVDPPAGVSPIDRKTRLEDDKYATLIYRERLPGWQREEFNCRFIRPTHARYLAIVFTTFSKEGRVVLSGVELVQSAHVVLVPRKSRAQYADTLNVRIIGTGLADDYASVGPDSFRMVVEHLIGGEPHQVLFEADSLYELIRNNQFRLFANQRYLETVKDVSVENADTLAGGFESRRTESRLDGWRHSQTGEETEWDDGAFRRLDDSRVGQFMSEQSIENRTHNEHLSYESIVSQMRDVIESFGKVINNDRNWKLDDLDSDQQDALDALFPPNDPTANRLKDGWSHLWKCLTENNTTVDQLLNIEGLRTHTLPPYLFFDDFVEAVYEAVTNPAGLSVDSLQALVTSNPLLGPLVAMQGISMGMNLGVGASGGAGAGLFGASLNVGNSVSAGVSLSTSPQLPTSVKTSTTGSTGTVSYQASRHGCSVAQFRNRSYDDGRQYVHYVTPPNANNNIAAHSTRQISRDLFMTGTVRERRAGVNVHWQGMPKDILSGSISLELELPATADKIYRTTDHALRVRFPNGLANLAVDVWFDMSEEILRDDY